MFQVIITAQNGKTFTKEDFATRQDALNWIEENRIEFNPICEFEVEVQND